MYLLYRVGFLLINLRPGEYSMHLFSFVSVYLLLSILSFIEDVKSFLPITQVSGLKFGYLSQSRFMTQGERAAVEQQEDGSRGTAITFSKSLHDNSQMVMPMDTELLSSFIPSPPFKSFVVREANLRDLNRVVSLRVHTFYPELLLVGSFHARILEKLRQRLQDGVMCLVAVQPNNFINSNPLPAGINYDVILGTVEFSSSDFYNTTIERIGHPKKIYVMDLAVRHEARRQGIASDLLEYIESYAREHEFREIYLHVEVQNDAARMFYKKIGYVELPPVDWAVQFTEKRLHKPPECYILLWKEIF